MDLSATPSPDAAARFADEADLVAALRRGDDDAYELLVREHGPRMLSVARRILRNEDDAADAVQEAFLSAFKAIDAFDENAKLSTWLHRIVVNACLMKLRSARRHPTLQIEDFLPRFLDDGHRVIPRDDWNQTPPDLLERQETAAIVRETIDQLPETHRTVLLLRDIEQLDTAETAKLLDVSSGVVKTRLHRARLALRELLGKRLSEGGVS